MATATDDNAANENQASLESVTYLFDVLEFGCIKKRR